MTVQVERISEQQRQFYNENGYLFPLRVFTDAETSSFRQQFDDYTAQNQDRLNALLPRERSEVYGLTHLCLPWAYEIVSHPKVLDAVEAAIGPNILVWSSDWFVKFPRDAAFISWHQDGAYWGLHPPMVTTAWIALSCSTLENGCMLVLPGTQNLQLKQRDTFAKNNALSRGQEIEVGADESKAIALCLSPGELSLHHIGIAHGSKPNNSDQPRIGFAVRYIAPEVMQDGDVRDIVQLVRGQDRYGNFEITGPPTDPDKSTAIRKEARKRLRSRLMQGVMPPEAK